MVFFANLFKLMGVMALSGDFPVLDGLNAQLLWCLVLECGDLFKSTLFGE